MAHPYLALAPPIVIGHRGCAGEAPENTLVGFEAGLAAGAAILETDAHLTRDGVPVLVHDPVVDRVSDGSGPVAGMTLAELRALDFGFRFSPDGGRSFPWRGRGVRIPTLEEALDAFPEARWNIELKADAEALVERAVAAIAERDAAGRTLLAAENDAIMATLRAHLERVGVPVAQGACTGDVLAFIRAALEDEAPPPGPAALQVPERFGAAPLVTERFVAHAHRHGLHVHVWTVNETADMERLLDLGVDGLVSDHPGRCARLIAARARR